MEARTLDRMSAWIPATALPLVGLAALAAGWDGAIGAIAGAALAVLNFRVIRFAARAMVRAGDGGRARLAALLSGKTIAVLAIVTLFLRIFDAVGLVLGVSAMVLGVVAGAVHAHVEGDGVAPAPAGGE